MKMNSYDITSDYHMHSTFSVDGQDTIEALGWLRKNLFGAWYDALFANLVRNAFLYGTRRPVALVVESERRGGWVVVRLTDNADGPAQRSAPHNGQRFAGTRGFLRLLRPYCWTAHRRHRAGLASTESVRAHRTCPMKPVTSSSW